jgi:hypothetical protein
MIPILSTLPRLQRAGYVLSGVLMGGGWLFLLALTLEWSSLYWSRPALALQAAALIVALPLMSRVPTWRLIAYPLTLAASIYLLDTTLPPPNFPSGWPREIIPRLVLVALVGDCLRAMRGGHGYQRTVAQFELRHVALDDAARLLGLAVFELRRRLQQRRFSITIDAQGREYLSLDQLRRLRQRARPRWWQLYGWLLLTSSMLLFVMPRAIPASWEMAAQVAWCVLTLGGMGAWVWLNQQALWEEDQARQRGETRAGRRASPNDGRTIPLTPVQERFLAVMEPEKDENER